jgi:hypothetical protein
MLAIGRSFEVTTDRARAEDDNVVMTTLSSG